FYEPGVTTRNFSGVDYYPYVESELGWGLFDGGTPDPTTWTWVPSTLNGAFVNPGPFENDEVMATFAPTVSGEYRYGYRFRMIDPPSGAIGQTVYCDQDGVVLFTPNWGTATVYA